MATYKVIQDIEAEDKLIGPFSFRQFIYLLIGAGFASLNYVSAVNGLWPALLVLMPPMAFCFFFAWPWSPDQPTEVWAVARIRFLFKPRKRIWNQAGIKEFVTITAPKVVQKNYTDGLSQTEVQSRLRALAHTIDSRGWAVKNAAYEPKSNVVRPGQGTDRLLSPAQSTQVSDLDIHRNDDIFDNLDNPRVQNLTDMLSASTEARRNQIMRRLNEKINEQPAPQKQWFAQHSATNTQDSAVIDAKPEQVKAAPKKTTKKPTAKPKQHVTQKPAAQKPAEPVSQQPDPAILNLARNNDLDVATLAREAQREKAKLLDASDGEVTISLH